MFLLLVLILICYRSDVIIEFMRRGGERPTYNHLGVDMVMVLIIFQQDMRQEGSGIASILWH